jgi:hypothetical protein
VNEEIIDEDEKEAVRKKELWKELISLLPLHHLTR